MSIFDLFRRRRGRSNAAPTPVVPHRRNPSDPPPADDLPPGFTPIETQISGPYIPGTSTLIGQYARVGQMPNGELVTCERAVGVRGGCGHDIFSAHETVTQTGIHRGIGGVCWDCAAEADELAKRAALSAGQAEAMSLYCSQCASHCDGCGRHNLCARHTKLSTDADGRQLRLCPKCSLKADRKKLFKQTISVLSWLFTEDDRPPQPKE